MSALIGKEVVHEYRGRGTVTAQENGHVVVRFGQDYELPFAYPDEFYRMLRLREPDAAVQSEIDRDLHEKRLAAARDYRAAHQK